MAALLNAQLVQIGVCLDRCQGIADPIEYILVNRRARARKLALACILFSLFTAYMLAGPVFRTTPHCDPAKPLFNFSHYVCEPSVNKALIKSMRFREDANKELRLIHNKVTWILAYSDFLPHRICCQIYNPPSGKLWMLGLQLVAAVVQGVVGFRLTRLYRVKSSIAKARIKRRAKAKGNMDKESKSATAERHIVMLLLAETAIQAAQTFFMFLLIFVNYRFVYFGKLLTMLLNLVTYTMGVAQLSISFTFPLIMSPSYRADLVALFRRTEELPSFVHSMRSQ